ncbi:MAG: lysophospholipid acyltransferase family protein [Verrucomicrobiales bacterium]|nr:lysophospholipid acyltransferase family protein [Verrucomicrobiales bacterium]
MGFWYWLGHTGARIFGKLVNSYRIENREGLAAVEGGLIIASNHVSFLDPPLIGAAFREPIYYFARRTLFRHPVANFLFTRVRALPVDQEKPELSSLKKVIQLVKADEKVLIFPEGERSWDGTMNMDGQPGIGMIVSKSGVPVLPIRLFGPEKSLARGSKKIKRHPVTLVVGEPMDFSDLLADKSIPGKEKYKMIADQIMVAIAALEMSESRGE